MFVNRQNELEALTTRFASGRAEFVVVTGRRRVGKTALLAAFANGKRALRFTAFLDSEEGQLRRLSALLRQLERPEAPAPPDFSYGSWEALFQTIGALAGTNACWSSWMNGPTWRAPARAWHRCCRSSGTSPCSTPG